MRNRIFAVLVAATLTIGCSYQKGGDSITGPSFTNDPVVESVFPAYSPLSMVIGTWTGVETASVGLSGTLSVVFTQPPTPDAVVAANITWTGLGASQSYTGTLTGTLSNMVITATNYVCGYTATGALNEAGTQITGSYSGTGSTHCQTKAGTFVLNGQSAPPPPPPPPACPTTVIYTGQMDFQLSPSSDAVELSWVQANVSSFLVALPKINGSATTWTSDGNYSVVLLKGAQHDYRVYVNVVVGQVLVSPSTNNNGNLQNISHISRFRCPVA